MKEKLYRYEGRGSNNGAKALFVTFLLIVAGLCYMFPNLPEQIANLF